MMTAMVVLMKAKLITIDIETSKRFTFQDADKHRGGGK